MKKLLILVLAVSFAGTAATATDIDLTVQEQGTGLTTIEVDPGAEVFYEVIGKLTDTDNEGLALIGLNLVFSGGDLSPADTPTDNPMLNFVGCAGCPTNAGLTNPIGYGGTPDVPGREGDLIQVGGSQNTIKNPGGVDPLFPDGTVIPGVAKTDWQVLITGSLTAPMDEGEYTLSIESAFANAIQAGATGDDPPDGPGFWPVVCVRGSDCAGHAGADVNMTIAVVPSPCPLLGDSSTPPFDGTLARTQRNVMRLRFDCEIAVAVGSIDLAGQIEIRELLDNDFGVDLSSQFTYSVEDEGSGPTVLRIEGPSSPDPAVFEHQHWYAIMNTGTWGDADTFEHHLSSLMGDADNLGTVNFSDITPILDLNGQSEPAIDDDERANLNDDISVNFSDITVVLDHNGSGILPKPDGH